MILGVLAVLYLLFIIGFMLGVPIAIVYFIVKARRERHGQSLPRSANR